MSMDREREAFEAWAKEKYEPKFGNDWRVVTYRVNHGDTALAAFKGGVAWQARAQAVQGEAASEMVFTYRHHASGKIEEVSLSRAEIAEHMSDELFDKLTARFCKCELIGETNVLDCNCDEYSDQFELQQAAPQPAPDVAGLLEALERISIGVQACIDNDEEADLDLIVECANEALSAHEGASHD